jgi:hypothetical protein
VIIATAALATALTFPILVAGLGTVEAWANAAANLHP